MIAYINTNLVAMAFMYAVLEAVHAENTSGIYGAVPEIRWKLFFVFELKIKN